ncbi:hypothetical protein KKB44_06325 [Candidatus Micrarchaeota archaeon]|nr:hypothetical protein [Candidatus Micrarchaeota archaeon]
MEFDELLITTGVDALVRLVKERQRIELDEASSILNIPLDTLEDWSRVLEEEGILRIEYRLTHIYLIWVTPTEEQIEEEKHSFYEEKEDIEKEVDGVKERINKETCGLEELQRSFTDFYTKTSRKIEDLEKTVSPLPAGKTISDNMFSKYQGELSQMDKELTTTKASLEQIRNEIKGLGVEKESPSKGVIDRMEQMKEELIQLEQEMQNISSKASKEKISEDVKMPSVDDIKKKFESIKKDFADMRSRNAKLREEMMDLHESSEILSTVAESIMGQEEKIGGLQNEVNETAKETEKLVDKIKKLDTQMKQNVDVVERLGESVTVAKNVLKKFPNQKKVLGELDELSKEEKKVLEQTESLGKLLDAVGGRQVTAKQFADISKKMETKVFQMKKDIEILESALEDEKSTYLTFQKIKERIVPSIESYRTKLEEMDAKIASIRGAAASEKQNLQIDTKNLQEQLKGGQMQGILKVAEEIREKKKILDEIKNSLDDLVAMSENLNKRVVLLSREAKLLQIRSGNGTPEPATEEKKEAIRHELQLSKEEEMEFRMKREELKKLIKTLWES